MSRLKPKERDEAKKEIKLLASFAHPNIVKYRDSFLETGVLHIVRRRAAKTDAACALVEDALESPAPRGCYDRALASCPAAPRHR